MLGFSWQACIGLIVSLFVILLVSPAGLRKTAEQVISVQVAWGSGYVTLCLCLLNFVMYIWLFNNGAVVSEAAQSLLNTWGAVVSSTFGAVYWVVLCLFFGRKIKTKSGILMLVLWPALILLQNYLPNLHLASAQYLNSFQPIESILNWISTALIAAAISVLSYFYWRNKHRWAEL